MRNVFLMGGSVALSIHVVLTFFRMHGLALTLAFVAFWLICVTAYFRSVSYTHLTLPTNREV